jgi:hypothetical protein
MTSPLLEWRPIDTCPREEMVMLSDGTQVEPGQRLDWGGTSQVVLWDFMNVDANFEPTYWMPFPLPPKAEKAP